ncbi:hypothetical protein Tco_0305160 [Tanacetum coccineum]
MESDRYLLNYLGYLLVHTINKPLAISNYLVKPKAFWKSVRYGVSKELDTANWRFLGARIRRIFLDGYGVLVFRIVIFKISSFKLQNARSSSVLTATADVLDINIQQFWKTVKQVPNANDTIRFMVDKKEIIYTLDMFHAALKLPTKTAERNHLFHQLNFLT